MPPKPKVNPRDTTEVIVKLRDWLLGGVSMLTNFDVVREFN